MAARAALERQVCEPAAVHLQAAGRRFLAAVLMRRLREEEEERTAALRLQTSGRRFLAAVLTRRLRNEEEERTERTFQIGAANSIRRAALAFVLRIRFAMAKRSATAIQAMARRMRAVALAGKLYERWYASSWLTSRAMGFLARRALSRARRAAVRLQAVVRHRLLLLSQV